MAAIEEAGIGVDTLAPAPAPSTAAELVGLGAAVGACCCEAMAGLAAIMAGRVAPAAPTDPPVAPAQGLGGDARVAGGQHDGCGGICTPHDRDRQTATSVTLK